MKVVGMTWMLFTNLTL